MRIFFLFIALNLCASCRFLGVGERVTGNGNIVTEDQQVGNFHSVKVGGEFVVKIRQSPGVAVQIQADQNLLQYIDVSTRNGALVIRSRDGYNLDPSNEMIIMVAAPSFRNIDVSGASDIIGEGTIGGNESLQVSVSGSGKIVLEVDVPEIRTSISGDGDAELRGRTRDFSAGISGSGSIKSFDLIAENCKLNISGAGDAEVHASKTLDVRISGAGNVEYRGNPQISKSISGAGNIDKAD